MIKFILQTLLTVLLGFFAHQFFPFWAIAAVAAVVGLLFRYENSASGFGAGFLAALLLWGGYAAWLDIANKGVLSGKMGEVFQLGGSYLVFLTGILGGMLGGFGALTGALARKMFEQRAVRDS